MEKARLKQKKLPTLGQISTSISHEVKNPLHSIYTLDQVMEEYEPKGDDLKEDLNTIRSEIEDLTDILMEDYILDGRSFQDAKQDYMRPIEKALVKEALKNSNQNITKAAELLGMKRQYLQQKIKNLN